MISSYIFGESKLYVDTQLHRGSVPLTLKGYSRVNCNCQHSPPMVAQAQSSLPQIHSLPSHQVYSFKMQSGHDTSWLKIFSVHHLWNKVRLINKMQRGRVFSNRRLCEVSTWFCWVSCSWNVFTLPLSYPTPPPPTFLPQSPTSPSYMSLLPFTVSSLGAGNIHLALSISST